MGKILRRKRVIPYSQDAMNKALKDVKSGTPMSAVCKKYQIPRSTLNYKFVHAGAKDKPGRDPVLSVSEEDKLVVWINFMCTLGRPLSLSQITNSVALLVKKLEKPTPFSDGRPGRHWCDGFFRRHKGVKEKIRETEKFGRAPLSQNSVKQWFTDIEECLQEENLLKAEPSRIFNIGEVNWPLYSGDILENESGSESSDETVDLAKFRIMLAGNAAGQLAPRMVIYYSDEDAKCQGNHFSEQDWHETSTHNGKMSAEIFYEYIVSQFYPWLIKNDIETPVILFLDGYVNYLSQLLCEFCTRHKIALVVLPPGATQLMQPIHVGFARKLKYGWGKAIRAYANYKKLPIENKADFAQLVIKVFGGLNIQEILINSFQWCGLYPFTVEAVHFQKLIKTRGRPGTKHNVKKQLQMQDHSATLSCKSSLIEAIERYIEPSVLDTFKSAMYNSEWTGKIEDKSLFYVWKKIVNNDGGNETKSTISAGVIVVDDNNENSEIITKLDSLPSECTILEINNDLIENECALKPISQNLDEIVLNL